MEIKTLINKIKRLNKRGEFCKKTFYEYYEESNKLMTIVNVITEFIEKIIRKEFSVSSNIRILNLSEKDKIYIIINKFINMITINNTQSNSSIVIFVKNIDDSINKNNSILFNKIIYDVFDNNVNSRYFSCFEQSEE